MPSIEYQSIRALVFSCLPDQTVGQAIAITDRISFDRHFLVGIHLGVLEFYPEWGSAVHPVTGPEQHNLPHIQYELSLVNALYE